MSSPSFAAVALGFVVVGILVASLWAWFFALTNLAIRSRLFPLTFANRLEPLLRSLRLTPHLPLLPWSPRRPVPWAFIDLVIIVGLYIGAGGAMYKSGLVPTGQIATLDTAEMQTVVAANMLLSLALVMASVLLVAVRCGANSRDLGVSARDVGADLRLGALGFVMLAPPIYGLQGLLVSFWKESKHPLLEMFESAPETRLFGWLFASAVVVAPLFEELLFRMLLQGFLEKMVAFRGDSGELILGSLRATAPDSPLPGEGEATGEPYAPQPWIANPQAMNARGDADQPVLRGILAWLPILVSSTIFALLHWEHGPDWVPLFFLALGIGYVYQRTHRILPGLIIHALLNALSMWGLWVQVKSGA